ncbi:MAG: ribosome biogenesis GTP-binding protein YihA/YsxC, partial [Candidatus Saganbacteria bacterium]|nr:ribosome biogenesis GTP-binding protein YihA/YsxC [Candidatus Saganbacteria bacterium]
GRILSGEHLDKRIAFGAIICYYDYMQIAAAKFVKGIIGSDKILEGRLPQIAFIGRSNVGKSSVINSLTNQKGLAKTSSSPGRTREINLFLINKSLYLLDLPGYGFAKVSRKVSERLFKLIDWYLFRSPYQQKKVVLIIDANIGPTDNDLEMLHTLEDFQKDIVIVANKIDKIKKSKYTQQLQEIKYLVGEHKMIPYSSRDKIGIRALAHEIFN